MKIIRTSRVAALALTGAVLASGLVAGPAFAAPATQETAESQDDADRPMTRKERRQKAKQERIDRYLEKKAAKRARKAEEKAAEEAERAERAAAEERARLEEHARAAEAEARDAERASAAGADDGRADRPRRSRWGQRRARAEAAPTGSVDATASDLPRDLQRVQDRLRRGPIGDDPDGRAYLDQIDSGRADARDLGELGNLLARRGYSSDAILYYRAALEFAPDNEALWLNLGSVHLSRGEFGSAERAFGRVLSMDPNQAFAHYNLGATYQAAGRYEEAVEAFRRALILDPELGDPEHNPAAATNELMVPVKLLLYKQQAGSIALPLKDIDATGTRTSPE